VVGAQSPKTQSININDEVLRQYVGRVVPAICGAGDDKQHGSSALCDIACLQVASREVHFRAESDPDVGVCDWGVPANGIGALSSPHRVVVAVGAVPAHPHRKVRRRKQVRDRARKGAGFDP
jgi:hypothetical protein